MKVALVYDRLNKFGGAERVLQSLHQIYPDAPLYTSLHHPVKTPWTKGWDIRPSFLNHFPFLRDKHEFLAPLMPYVFESFDFSDFDVVISITSAEAKGIITNPHTLHVCYLLTPTRYLWSHTHHYQGRGVKKLLTSVLLSNLRRWDYIAATRPDHFLTISKNVSQRLHKYYHQPSHRVIYPPVDTHRFSHHPSTCFTPLRNYFLVVSRLVSYKHIDTTIKAFRHLPQELLIIVGTGQAQSQLQSLAGKNVSFKSHLSDRELACLYHHAQGLIFTHEEDFGIVALEAQSAAVPVIALNRGGASETVIDQQTGFHIGKTSTPAIIDAINALKHHTWYDEVIQLHARRFDQKHFASQFSQTIEELWQSHQPK